MLSHASKLFLIALIALSVATIARADEDAEFFEKQIRPLLVEHCQKCHGDQKHESGLQLTSRTALLRGGDSGTAVVPGEPDASLLIRAVNYLDEPKMPPKQKLPEADIRKLRDWVSRGAPWPEPTGPPTPARKSAESDLWAPTAEQQKWWAFQPLRDPILPPVRDPSWAHNGIDRFVLADLEVRGLPPAPAADRRTWLRRVTFDLMGLPPSPDELDAFLADETDLAFERVVDRLLASPAYGQRWARHWLDVARYADYHDGDPKARDANCEPMQAWRYRDWVVTSFNHDLPFDQFIVHQIAGDLLPVPEGDEFYADGLIATTFLTNGVWDRGDADKEKMVSDMVDDNIDTIGKAFLGLTLGCARCHDHKFDPIAQRDYYGLAGIFYSTRILQELGSKGGNYTLHRVPLIEREYVEKRAVQLQQLNEIKAKLTELDKRDPQKEPPEDDPERKSLVAQRDQAQAELLPEPPMAEAVAEGGTPGGLFPGIQDVPIHVRGSYTRLGEIVPRQLPAFFSGQYPSPIASGSGRRELAEWIVSPDHPLTARVLVNRVWQWHFGTGLVATPNNFGLTSQPPSHPALLDWLAVQFIRSGWSVKELQRLILLSATYGQSSQRGPATEASFARDPENCWLGRFVPRRLEAESIRDAMLSVAGQLDMSFGGPASDNLAIARRSLYVQTARWDRGSFATLFDAANSDASEEKRIASTVAPQALFLLNNPFTLSQAQQLAERLQCEVPGDTPELAAQRIRHAYRLAVSREPDQQEITLARQLIAAGAKPESGWVEIAHVLLCSNEFVYID
jgi:hypothetical protein